jgi:hypothetical protein
MNGEFGHSPPCGACSVAPNSIDSAPVVVVLGKADNQTAFPRRLKPSS